MHHVGMYVLLSHTHCHLEEILLSLPYYSTVASSFLHSMFYSTLPTTSFFLSHTPRIRVACVDGFPMHQHNIDSTYRSQHDVPSSTLPVVVLHMLSYVF